ncbi:MAG TPA: PAS domain-containing protein [Flavisolibacter sp.]|nr:PAS domain-containing protein [Flavisolibacter sp.]
MNTAKPLAFLNGGGAMGELIQQKDWSKSPLGPPDTWPKSLQTAVSILLNSQFPMFVWWGEDLITIYNDAYRPIAGEKHPDLLGTSGREGWAEIWHDLEPLVESVFKGKATWSEDQPLYMNRHGFIEETYFTFSYSPLWDESGVVEGLFCACIETTGKLQAARRIQESERNLRATILQSPVAMCILRGPSYVVEIANNRMFELWGRGAGELLSLPIFEGLPEVRNQGLEELLQQVFTTGKSVTASERPVQLPRKSGVETVYINFVYEPFREGDGSVSGIICVASEVTDQVLARKRVEESEQNFRLLVEQAPVAMNVVRGPKYVMEIINPSMLEILGKKKEDILNKPVFESMPELRSQGFEALLHYVYKTGKRISANEHRIQFVRDGETVTRYLNFVYEPLKDVDGKVNGLMAVSLDVTEQVTARRKIEESSEELQLAIEVANLGTFRLDIARNQAAYSPRIMEWFGFSEQGVSLDVFASYIHPEDRSQLLHALEESYRSEEKSQHDVVYRVVHPESGVMRYLHSFGRTYFMQDGKPYLLVGMIQDVTAQILWQQRQKENETELQKRVSERTIELENLNQELKRTNANLEEFAYAASHDMKEPIRKIHLFADRLKQELAEKLTPEQQHLFSRVENAAKRMGLLIEDLLTYSHVSKGVSHREIVDLNTKVQNVLEDLEVEIDEKKAEITIGALPTIYGHKRQLQQLFQNLIGNALKYSKPDVLPQITITAKLVYGSDTSLHMTADAARQQYHLLEVKDNGIGFEQVDAERIFNVFTRLHGNAEYKGTGVGLSIAKKVMENHQGFIWAESQPGVGTSFKMLFPVTET